MRGGRAPVLAASIALVSAFPDVTVAAEPVPWTVRAEVRWSHEGGTESVREAVERAAVRAAGEAGCVSRVTPDPAPEAELLWTVLLVEIEEETVYDDSVYGVQTPGEPGKDLLFTARIRLDLVSRVSRADGGASERAKRIHFEESRRPRMRGEDTAAQLRADAVRRVRLELGKALCRGAERLYRKAGKGSDR